MHPAKLASAPLTLLQAWENTRVAVVALTTANCTRYNRIVVGFRSGTNFD